jgi:hypothetical protein
MVTVLSLGQAVDRLESELFVGREAELAIFTAWLDGASELPDVLNVSGPSGVGKSTLLRAFQRVAMRKGKSVVLVDGASSPATVGELLSALTEGLTQDLDEAVARLNGTRSLILVDTFDRLGKLTEYLKAQLIPRLGTGVRLVIAGRYPLGLAWDGSEPWRPLIHPLRLEGLSESESREYLNRRGVHADSLVEGILRAAGSNPLALSLAADLALRFGVSDFSLAPEWRLAVRSLIERVLIEVRDPDLRELVEAGAAVRQLDEATLAAVTGRNDITAAFARLCQLSIVMPTQHGLMLHEDVRRWLADDLAWRNPERYNALRSRALAYYRERLRSASADEREWLIADRLFLWTNSVIQRLFFCADNTGPVSVRVGCPSDRPGIEQVFSTGMGRWLPAEVDVARLRRPKCDAEFLSAVLQYPGTRLRVARDQDGTILGFSTILPVCRETITLLDLHPAYAPLVHAYWTPAELAALPYSPDSTSASYLLHLVHGRDRPGGARAALLRELSCVFAKGGIHLCATFIPAYKQMLEMCGYERLPSARNEAWGAHYPVDGYVLNLSQIGVETWIDAIVNDRRPPRPLDRAELANELQNVFRRWNDDGRLARSRLVELTGITSVEADAKRASAVRQKILQAVTEGRATAPASLEAAYQALEITYLSRRPGHKSGARTLAVSRATLYRLLKRGIAGLADALSESA